MAPTFSVIIPLYNKEKHIEKTIRSVLQQTIQDFEIIIVNDGSTDSSLNRARRIKDDRIKIFEIANQGVSFARNNGIEKSISNLIAFLDADDYWYPHHLEDLKKLHTNFPNCGIYAKGYEKVFHNKTAVAAKFSYLEVPFFGIVKDFFKGSLIDSIAWTSAIAIPRPMLDTYGLFDVSLKSGQDTDLWIRIALKEKVAFDSRISAKKIMSHPDYHLSQSSKVADRVRLLEKFNNQEQENKSFKTFMDLNRFSIAIERKMAGDFLQYKDIKADIDTNNLNWKQNLLLKSPRQSLKILKAFHRFLIKRNLYLSAFK